MNDEIEWTPKARQIVDAASELFYAHGIHAVGVDAIAARAGVTKKTLYDRFGSKQQLVVEYLTYRDRAWRAFLQGELDAAGADPRERLAAVFRASARWAAEWSGKGCSMINAHAEISSPEHPAYAVIVGQKQWMLELFTELVEAMGVSDSQRRARLIMLAHEGALVTDGIGVIDDAYASASDLALSIAECD